jgi:hypothetical protein
MLAYMEATKWTDFSRSPGGSPACLYDEGASPTSSFRLVTRLVNFGLFLFALLLFCIVILIYKI